MSTSLSSAHDHNTRKASATGKKIYKLKMIDALAVIAIIMMVAIVIGVSIIAPVVLKCMTTMP